MSRDKPRHNDYIYAINRAIDRVIEARSKIIFRSDEYSPRKVAEYLESIKSLISIIPKEYLPKSCSRKMKKINTLYKNHHYSQVVKELDKVLKEVNEIFGKLNNDGFFIEK